MLFATTVISLAFSVSAAELQHSELHARGLLGGLLGGGDKCKGQHNLLLNLAIGDTFNCPPPQQAGGGLAGGLAGGFGDGFGGGFGGDPSQGAYGYPSPYFDGAGGSPCGSQYGTINVAAVNQYDCPYYGSSQPLYKKEAKPKHSDKVAKRSDKGLSHDKQDAKLLGLIGLDLFGINLKDAENRKSAKAVKRAEKGAVSGQKQDAKLLGVDLGVGVGLGLGLKDAEKANSHTKSVKRAEKGASSDKKQDAKLLGVDLGVGVGLGLGLKDHEKLVKSA